MTKSKKETKQRSNRLKKTVKRLAAYSAVAAVTVVTTQDRSANAQEVVWDIPDQAIANLGLLFNITTGNYGAATLSYYNSAEGSFRLGSAFFSSFLEIAGPGSSGGAGFVGPGGFGAGFYYVSLLGLSSSVGSSRAFNGRTDFPSYGIYAFLSSDPGGAPFMDERGFVGLRFEIGGETYYGWAEISGISAAAGGILHAFGYNQTAGAASITGGGPPAIPEPSSIMFLAAGAAGMGAWRRRRKAS